MRNEKPWELLMRQARNKSIEKGRGAPNENISEYVECAIVFLLQAEGPLGLAGIICTIGLAPRVVETRVNNLLDEGRITTTGDGIYDAR